MPYALNLLDLALTLYALRLGYTELNPLMQSPMVMIFYKVIIVGGLCWWLQRRTERMAKVGLNLCTAVYGGLCIYHLYGIYMIGGM